MKDIEAARALADVMLDIGRGAGREVRVLLTDMSSPLGGAVGNALEICEVVELLQDGGPADLRELVFTAAGVLLSLSDLDVDEEEGRLRARQAVADGSAWNKYREWIAAQGGDPDAELALAPVQNTVLAPSSGVVTELDALAIGLAAARLGAGRQRKEDAVDHGVGIRLFTGLGERIAAGEPLMTVYARTEEAAATAASEVEAATVISPQGGSRRQQSVILERRG